MSVFQLHYEFYTPSSTNIRTIMSGYCVFECVKASVFRVLTAVNERLINDWLFDGSPGTCVL